MTSFISAIAVSWKDWVPIDKNLNASLMEIATFSPNKLNMKKRKLD